MKVRLSCAAIAAAILFTAAPACAQGAGGGQPRESIQFLNAVRERDGNKVNTYLQNKALRILNVKDPYGDGDGALHIIARIRSGEYLSVFLSQPEINPNLQNRKGDTPLIVAIDSGWEEGVAKLIAAKANINLPNSAGETPLIRAVLLHDESIVRLLLAAGADADKADYQGGLSAREYAARETRYPAIAKMLAAAPKGGGRAAAAAGPGL